MVLVSSKKYACETCIKGHRSSSCKHTDRPLFEIKKKGRPVTQCDHCRELRKTKQVHVKCVCESKGEGANSKEPDASGTKKKCNSKVLESAAFPNGLPEALEASVAVHLPSDSSDSDHSGEMGCTCKDGGNCTCATPRKNASRHHRKGSLNTTDDSALDGNAVDSKLKGSPPTSSNLPLSSHILARIAELRPVRPKPPTSVGPLHDPSSGMAHGSGIRHHTHENMYFSPYGRAYEHIHTPDRISHDRTNLDGPPRPSLPPATKTIPPTLQNDWTAGGMFPSLCGCGDNCACPGCKEHNASTFQDIANAFSSCANPEGCSTCLDCSISSAFPSNGPLSIYEVDASIDEWLRQVASVPTDGELQSPLQIQVPTQTPWDALQMTHLSTPSSECGPECHCPPGLCTCQRGQLTFAVSGERACCPSDNNNQIMSMPTALSSSSSLVVAASSTGSHTSLPNARSLTLGGEASRSQEIVYALGQSDSEPPLRQEYSTAVYANSNPDSDRSHDEFEYRQPTGVYAMSNPDSEQHHEEFEYDPRFDYAAPIVGANGTAIGSGHGPRAGDVKISYSNNNRRVSLENFEQYQAYNPSLDGMQLY